ncbi:MULTISPECIES: carotenoid oxygenase family protein, partial [unclassified Blastomonas]
MNRRDLLIGGGLAALGTLAPVTARAAAAVATAPDWTLGTTDILADIAPRSLRRIQGRAPDLAGTLYRNGPARFRRGDSASGHWFDGDGLIRAWQLRGNEARLAARFVDTPKRRLEEKLGRIVQPGFGTLEQPGA